MNVFGRTWRIVKQTFAQWSGDRAPSLAAALSFYTMFSLAPLLIIAMAIAGLVVERAEAQQYIFDQISGTVGESSAKTILLILKNAFKPATGAIATVIGLVTLLIGATAVLVDLQGSLNAIWRVEAKPGRLIIGLIKERFVSFVVILGAGFLFVVSMLVSASLSAMSNSLSGMYSEFKILLHFCDFVISFIVTTLLFAMIFKVVPDVKVFWKDVWVGAVTTAILFTIGKILIGLYLARSGVESAYGAAGSLVIFLVWVYYSAQIFFFGAVLTHVFAQRHHTPMMPKEYAVPIEGVT